MLSYDLSQIPHHEEICFQRVPHASLGALGIGPNPEEEGWVHDKALDEYVRLSPKTSALVNSAAHVHLSEITSSNVDEWYYRLESLFDAGLGFLTTESDEGPVPLRLRVQDLTDHIGLRIRVLDWSKEQFDSHVRRLRKRSIDTEGPL